MRPIYSTACGLIAVCILSLILCPAVAQEQQQTRNRDRDRLTLATYEVGDLIVYVPDYSLAGEGTAAASAPAQGYGGGRFGGMGHGMGGMGGGFGGGMTMSEAAVTFGGAQMGIDGGSSQQQQITIDSLRNAIVSVVAPETWAISQAGGQGRIEVVGTAFVVSQTEEAHQEINQLLDQLRDGSATRRTVSIDARWLLLNSDDLDRLVTSSDDGDRRIDRKTLDELTRRATSLRGATKCFSGQAVYVISGTQRSFVSSYIPVVGSVEMPAPEVLYAVDTSQADIVFAQSGRGGEGAAFGGRGVGYQPVITTPNFGATLEVRPTLSVKGDDAVIDLKSTVTFPSPEQAIADPAAMPGMPPVDRVAIQLQKLATTLRVRLGEPVLVGGMTYLTPTAGDGSQPAPQDVQADPGEQRQLYLVIELK